MWVLTAIIWLCVVALFVVFLFEMGWLPLRGKRQDRRWWLAQPPAWQYPPPSWGEEEPLPEWLANPGTDYPPADTDAEGCLR